MAVDNDPVYRALAALVENSGLPSQFRAPVLNNDTGYSFASGIRWYQSDDWIAIAGAARTAVRSALVRRDQSSVSDVAYILGQPAPTLADAYAYTVGATAGTVVGAATTAGQVVSGLAGAVGNAGKALGQGFDDGNSGNGPPVSSVPWVVGFGAVAVVGAAVIVWRLTAK